MLGKILKTALTISSERLPSPRKRSSSGSRQPEAERRQQEHEQRRERMTAGVTRAFSHSVMAKLGEHWLLAGFTGTGKTTLAKKLIARYRRSYPHARIYILDSKQSGMDFDEYPGIIRSAMAPDPLATPGGVQVWQPISDDPKEYDRWLTRIYEARQPAIVLIDELSNLGGKSGLTFPRGFDILMKQGRALLISMIVLTQEAAYIPRTALGQATHVVRFRLKNELDGRRIDRSMGRPESEWGENPRDRYGYYYANENQPGRTYYYRSSNGFIQE